MSRRNVSILIDRNGQKHYLTPAIDKLKPLESIDHNQDKLIIHDASQKEGQKEKYVTPAQLLDGVQTGKSGLPAHDIADHGDADGTTDSRTSSSDKVLLQAKAMDDHRNSGDHDGRYLRNVAITVSGDWNDVLETGFFQGSGLANGCPGSHSWKFCIVTRHHDSWVSQIMHDFNGTGLYCRTKTSGNWQPWQRLDHRTTASRTSSSTALILQAKAMNDHRNSGDHDGRYYTKNQVDGMTGGELTAVSPSSGLVAVHGLSGNFVKWDGWPGGNNRRYKLAKLVLSHNWNNIAIKGSVYGSSGSSVGQTDFMFYVRTHDPSSNRNFSGWRRVVWEDARRIHCHIVEDASSNDVYLCATASDAALQSMKWEFKVMARNGQNGVSVSNFNIVDYFDQNDMPDNHVVWVPDTISYAAG